MKQGISSISFFLLTLSLWTKAAPVQVIDLRVDLQTKPTGVSSTPRLSWKLVSDEIGKRQKGYHILAASSLEKLTPETADLWNSETQRGSFKHLIEWKGKELKEGQEVHWKVSVLDEGDTTSAWSRPASFTVGGIKTFPKPARTSTFKSSSAELNALYHESVAQLEERLAKFSPDGSGSLGTGAELQRAARAILYHFDALPHLTHWLHQMDANMTKDGFFPIHPGSKKIGSVSSEAGITVNHGLWWMGGDHSLPSKRWTLFEKHMIAREKADYAFKGTAWGEIEASEGMSAEFIDLCYLGYTTRLTRELAVPAQQPMNVIRFQDYNGRIRKSFEKQYLGENGNLKVTSQSAHLLALRSAVLKKENQAAVIATLLSSIEKDGLKVGPIGAHFLPSVLSLTQNQDKAVELLTKLTDEQKKAFIGNGVSGWLISYLAGIDASLAGFAQTRITPRIPSGDAIKWVEASYDSVAGKIAVRWEKLAEGALKIDISIPAGSLGRINLPCLKEQSVTVGEAPLEKALGLAQTSRSDSIISLIGHSGTYSFLIK